MQLALLMFIIFLYQVNGQCDPCEEYAICQIDVSVENDLNSHMLTLKNNNEDVSNCYTQDEIECFQFEKYEHSTNSTIKVGNETITTRVLLYNLSRYNESMKFEVFANYKNKKYQRLMHSCIMEVYKILKKFECFIENFAYGLLIKCFSGLLYPSSTCEFNVTINKVKLDLIPVNKHKIERQNPTYYSTECTVNVANRQLVPGVLQYNVAMVQHFPSDCSNRISCYKRSIFSSEEFKIEKPFNCSNNYSSNDEFCLDGKIYDCQNVSDVISNIQEWCHKRSQENIVLNQSSSCDTACKSYNQTTPIEKRNIIDNYILMKIFAAILALIAVGGIIGYCFKKHCPRSNDIEKLKVSTEDDLIAENEPLTSVSSQDSPTSSVNSTDGSDTNGITSVSTSENEVDQDSSHHMQDNFILEHNQLSSNNSLDENSVYSKDCVHIPNILLDTAMAVSVQIAVNNMNTKISMQETCLVESAKLNDDVSLMIKLTTDGIKRLVSQPPESLDDRRPIEHQIVPLESKNKSSEIIKFSKVMPNGSVRFSTAEVSLNTSIIQLKQDLVDLFNIPAEDQLWYLKNKLIEDETFLRDYSISESDTILMKAKQPTVKKE